MRLLGNLGTRSGEINPNNIINSLDGRFHKRSRGGPTNGKTLERLNYYSGVAREGSTTKVIGNQLDPLQ